MVFLENGFLFLMMSVAIISTVYGKQCSKLESGDLTGFDTKQLEGDYELVMLTIDDPFTKIADLLKCNRAIIRQHANQAGGVNVALQLHRAEYEALLCNLLPHFDSSTTTHGDQLDYFSIDSNTWRNMYFDIVYVSPEAVVMNICSKDADNVGEERSYVFVFRKKESTLGIEDLKNQLPDSIKGLDSIITICD